MTESRTTGAGSQDDADSDLQAGGTEALIAIWLRAIRIRFLLASVISVTAGIAVSYWRTGNVSAPDAALTYVGVAFLHASVDLLNDYWDHKRGIDAATKRTKFSGGTGVLPERLLAPSAVYRAGVIFLILGAAVGVYFVVTKGITVALILGFAVVAIYFYSTSIVNAGLGELFVAVKGALIVLGSFYVQTSHTDPAAISIGAVIGLLSATVLFVNSFPDYSADKVAGRRTLVILLGRNEGARIFPLFFAAGYAGIIACIALGYANLFALVSLASAPLAIRACMQLGRSGPEFCALEPAMASTVMFSRVTGFALAASFLIR